MTMTIEVLSVEASKDHPGKCLVRLSGGYWLIMPIEDTRMVIRHD